MNEITKPKAPAAPTKTSFKPLRDCQNLDEAFRCQEFMERIAASVPKHVQPDRMLRTFMTAVTRAPLLAQASLRSFVGACLTASQVGLEPNTPLGHLWMIPFKTKAWNPATRKRDQEVVEINVIFGYPGLLDLSFRTGLVKSVHADVVWPGDEFSYEYGSDAHVRHRPKGMARTDDTRPIYAYMHACLRDGQAFEVMPYSEVLRIRDRSQAYRAAVEARDQAQEKGWRAPATYTEAPWVAHEIAMARKTVFRSGSKWLPRSIELASAITLDEAQERRQRMDFGRVLDAPMIEGSQDYLAAAVDVAQAAEPDEGEPRGVDPSTAHADRNPDRQPRASSPPPTFDEPPPHPGEAPDPAPPPAPRPTVRKADRPRDGKSDTAPKPAPDPASSPAPDPAPDPFVPSFEAVVIDADGEPGDDVYVHPVPWARAFAHLWATRPDGTDNALLEHNADALADARQNADAAKLLDRTLAPDQPATPPPPVTPPGTMIETILPPVERGRTSWASWVRLFKRALTNVPDTVFLMWAEAQDETIRRAPIGQRVLVVRALIESAHARGLTPPDWTADALRPANGETPPDTTVDPPVAPEATAVAPEEKSADERWVANTEAHLATMDDADAFQAFVQSSAVQTLMRRLRRDNPALFERANAAFSGKYNEFNGGVR